MSSVKPSVYKPEVQDASAVQPMVSAALSNKTMNENVFFIERA